jgi:hypothetical protein
LLFMTASMIVPMSFVPVYFLLKRHIADPPRAFAGSCAGVVFNKARRGRSQPNRRALFGQARKSARYA